jgi:TIP41-like family
MSGKGKRSCVYGSDADLRKFGGARETRDNMDDFLFRGWRFSSFHTKIVDSTEASSMQDSICERLGIERHTGAKGASEEGGTFESPNKAFNLHIPPMIFGHDVMRIEKVWVDDDTNSPPENVFNDGIFQLSLNAEDALTLWAAQHTSENLKKHGLSVIQVPYAAIWAKMNGLDCVADSADAKPSQRGETSSSGALQIDRRSPLWDWTFSSDYCCTLGKRSKTRQHIIGVKGLYSPLDSNSADPLLSSIQPSSTSGIDYHALRVNDVPILFYDEILLYQDDLEDCGEVVFEAKLRVMPHCWFLLSRMFLRVDGVLLRIRDNRFFHKFGSDVVHLEVTWKECKLGLKVDKSPAGSKEDDDSRPCRTHSGAPYLNDGVLYIDGSSMRDIHSLAQICPVISTHNSRLLL